jgi:transcriptional regulator with XRE-family HTH domain
MSFGEELRSLRELKGVSLRGLARKCEMSPAYLSRIENGKQGSPSASTIARLAAELGLDGDLMAIEAGKIPEWMKDLLLKEGAACLAAMREIEKTYKED